MSQQEFAEKVYGTLPQDDFKVIDEFIIALKSQKNG